MCLLDFAAAYILVFMDYCKIGFKCFAWIDYFSNSETPLNCKCACTEFCIALLAKVLEHI